MKKENEELSIFDFAGIDFCEGKEAVTDTAKKISEVVVAEVSGTSKNIIPIEEKEFANWCCNNGNNELHVVSGKIKEITDAEDRLLLDVVPVFGIKNSAQKIEKVSLKIQKNTKTFKDIGRFLQPNITITALVDKENICKSVKYGPMFGAVSFGLTNPKNKVAAKTFKVFAPMVNCSLS